MSEQKEIGKLQAKRAELESESHSLQGKQKTLEDNIVILEEQIAIEQLQANNKAVQEAIAQLEAKKNALESKLKQVAQPAAASAIVKQTMPEANVEQPVEATEPAEAASEELVEGDAVTVTAIDGEELVAEQEEMGESLKKQQEKKKHRLF